MKQILISLSALVLGINIASAQVPDKIAFTANNPFMVGHSTMPAGKYTVRAEDSLSVIDIAAPTGETIHVLAQAAQLRAPAPKTEVEFADRGGTLYLTAIRIAGEDFQMEPLPDLSHAER